MRRLVILGAGESGVGTAILGKKKGFEVFVSDKGKIQEKYRQVLLHHKIDFEESKHTEELLLNADLVMKSPGIPDKVTIVQQLIERGVPVISEIEFASQFTNAKIVGITGTNGKTTTTMLTYHLLKEAGLQVGMAGNIGDSYAQYVAENDMDEYVLEISSFQLDGIIDFKPYISIITSITPDHLDRYDYDFSKYIASKFRISMNQKSEDYLIYDHDDPVIAEGLKEHKPEATLVPFSVEKTLEYGAFLKDDKIITRLNTDEFSMSISKLTSHAKKRKAPAVQGPGNFISPGKTSAGPCPQIGHIVRYEL